MNTKIIHVDGTAASVAMWHQLHVSGTNVIAVHVHTGNEHPETRDYLAYLRNRIGEIVTVRQDFSSELEKKRARVNVVWRQLHIDETRILVALEALQPTGTPFLDMCLVTGRFPGYDAAFCEPELIYYPLRDQVVRPVLRAGDSVTRYVEKESKAAAESHALSDERIAVLPDEEAARAYLRDQSINEHPSYFEDAAPRCAVCFKDSKLRIRHIAQTMPGILYKIAEWEQRVSLVVLSKEASYFHSGRIPASQGNNKRVIPIHEVANWSLTTKGGRNSDWVELVKGKRL